MKRIENLSCLKLGVDRERYLIEAIRRLPETLDHPALAETEDLSAMGAEVDNVGPLNDGKALCPRVHLGELLSTVGTQGRKILPLDDRERFVSHL